MMFRPYLWMSLFVLISLVILFFLGLWQWNRYTEKLERRDAPPVEFELISVEAVPVAGKFAQQVYGLDGGTALWRRYIPVRPVGGGEITLTLFDVTTGAQPEALPLGTFGQLDRPSRALDRRDLRTVFTPANQPEQNTWYSFDSVGMLANLGFEVAGPVNVIEPATITYSGRTRPNPFAQLKPIDPLPPERHFGYAVTWWGLGFALIGVYAVFHHSKGRLRFRAG